MRLLVLYILFTQSKGYSYIKICSSYKNNGTLLKLTVFLRQIYLMRICIHDWKFYLSHDYKVVCFGQGVDTQFSHESGMSTECVKIELFLQEHFPLIRVQVDSLFCTMSIQIKEHTAKRYTVSVNRSNF